MKAEQRSAIAMSLGMNLDQASFESITGGSIARAYQLCDKHQRFFVKCMNSSEADLLREERRGLELLAEADAVRTPDVFSHGVVEGFAWLALSWVELKPLDASACAALGRQLARLHRPSHQQFGLEHDNFIGLTPQINQPTSEWTQFFFQHRLGVQLRLLDQNQPGHEWSQYLDALRQGWEHQFTDYQPEASLLHGDLWSGNAGQTSDGQPIIFDPAVHYGDRECDLAMADLFGGFSPSFFDAYNQDWPLQSGWQVRRRFYQLYHLLNHANLFGGHYVMACKKRLLELS